MNLNATFIGQLGALLFLLLFAHFISRVCFNVGKRKTTNPDMNRKLGFFLGLFPPLGILYLIILSLKQDIIVASKSHADLGQ